MKGIKGIIKPAEISAYTASANGLNALIILLLYTLAFALIYLCRELSFLPVTIVSMFMMGAIQHTLATFIHEAAHGHVFSHKSVNEKLGHFFFAAPLFSYLDDYRYFHLEHHRHTGKLEKDPELKFYRALGLKNSGFSKQEVLMIFIKSICGIYAVKGLYFLNQFYMTKRKEGAIKKPGLFEHGSVAFWLLIVPFIMWKLNLFESYIIVWIIPMFTILTTLLLWHGFGEHIREKEVCLSQNTLTHRFNIVTTLFLYPINSSYHLEHHLYPQIPWHRIKSFRKCADQNPEYRQLASELEVDSLLLSKKSVIHFSFPNKINS